MLTHNICQEHDTMISAIPELHKYADMVTHEDSFSFIKGIKDYFVNTLPLIAKSFVSNADRVKSIDKHNKEEYNSFIKAIYDLEKDIAYIESLPFYEVENIKIPVMLGMKENLYITANLLSIATKDVNDHINVMLDYADTVLSLVLGNEDFRKASRFDFGLVRKAMKEENKNYMLTNNNISVFSISGSLQEHIYKLIDGKNYSDKRNVSQLIPNMNSLYDIQNTLLNAAKGTKLETLEGINANVSKLAERTEVLFEYTKLDKNFEVSKVVLNELGAILEYTAKSVTATTTIWHIMNQTATTLKYLVDTLKEYKRKL